MQIQSIIKYFNEYCSTLFIEVFNNVDNLIDDNFAMWVSQVFLVMIKAIQFVKTG